MSGYSTLRDALEGSAVEYASEKTGIPLPPKPVTSKTKSAAKAPSFMAQLAAASKKYRVALWIGAGLGVLVLIKMRR